MKFAKNFTTVLCMLALMSTLLLACGKDSGKQNNAEATGSNVQTSSPYASEKAAESTEEAPANTRKIKDYVGHEVEIPTSPQRIIYWGETLSDLIALDAKLVGAAYIFTVDSVYEDKVKQLTDVGFPINLEISIGLNPDLIITGDADEKVYEQLSKIAPTIVFDTFASLEDRMLLLGDYIGKKQEAEQWIAKYNDKTAAMWKQLHDDGVIQPGETASVFTYYPGDRLFVMARAGLPQTLYVPDGFKPTEKIQAVLDSNKGFAQLSMETLPEFAGDRIFILNPTEDESRQSTEAMMKSSIWLNLPAVKKGHVYYLDINKSNSDAIAREWLVDELPKMILK
ncbi:ABC transporter substrate-binding protein [Cohnella abietis]|uniref:Fe/B12 periplasmic-binding domain-containing protein n=1 Tax=Cohnella abietis TaxID=2507935 RepID=A0A3T1D4L9_9BACL|nr:ABC transporter substrate-binding protein [Cohnella abietis]BBI32959.1 hypothetical protein KCTCHS21_23580 [Cohnella abietis]